MNNIIKYILILSLFSTSYNSYSQNKGYKVIYDSIYPNLQVDYKKAKELWREFEQKYTFDPSEKLLFLGYSLKNNDIKMYKKGVIPLMRDYGWNYSYIDTLEWGGRYSILNEIKNNKLEKWTHKKSKKHYSTWVKNHPESTRINGIINALLQIDQAITRFVALTTNLKDSSIINSLIKEIDFSHIERIRNLCLTEKTMLNNFDHGIGIYYKIQIILLHNLKTKDNFTKSWEMLFPFIEKAYLQGKISSSIFMLYDQWNYKHFGCQYFGTLGLKVPVKEEETLKLRKQKYNL